MNKTLKFETNHYIQSIGIISNTSNKNTATIQHVLKIIKIMTIKKRIK